jgi:hypothetical protein
MATADHLPLVAGFDLACFLLAIDYDLFRWERAFFMNPLGDAFQDCDEIEMLAEAGVRIILLGHHVSLLQARLDNTEVFINKYANGCTNDLVAIAYCAQPTSTMHAQMPSARFTVTDEVLERLGEHSELAYVWLEHDLLELPCTNSSLAPPGGFLFAFWTSGITCTAKKEL